MDTLPLKSGQSKVGLFDSTDFHELVVGPTSKLGDVLTQRSDAKMDGVPGHGFVELELEVVDGDSPVRVDSSL